MKEASHKRLHIRWCHFYEMSRRGKFIETKCGLVVALGMEVEGIEDAS